MRITHEDWLKEGAKRYGEDRKQWKFKCPLCKTITIVQEWIDAGEPRMIAFSCIGRTKEKRRDAFAIGKKGPCNYAGGGLFRLNPITIIQKNGESEDVFDFANQPLEGKTDALSTYS